MGSGRTDWKRGVERTAECIPVERLGEKLSAAERAHLEGCLRCSAEMALWMEFLDSRPCASDEPEVRSIVDRLRRHPSRRH